MLADCLFFPELRRREKYCTNKDGEYYANYQKYRQEIRKDCFGRCVYCDLHENDLGGQTNMQIDHFRPERRFPELANNPHNLVWSCVSCNLHKSDHWPALETNGTFVGNEGFIDPFEENRLDYFEVRSNGSIIPLKPPAKYIETRLVLNRSTAKSKRRLRYQAHELIPAFEREIAKLEQLKDLSDKQAETLSTLQQAKANCQSQLDFSLRDD